MAQETLEAPSAPTLADARLPVTTLKDALPHLRRPFAPEAVKFKVQTVFKDAVGCIVVTYIDARLVIERLNAVVGAEWEARPAVREGMDPRHLWCQLTVFGRPRMDIGQSPKGESKDLWSDALKRAAVQFGVGVSIYDMRQVTLFVKDHGAWLDRRMAWSAKHKKEMPTLVLTDEGHARLRAGYTKWLEAKGVQAFGPVLAHGDDGSSVHVEPEPEQEDGFVPEAPAPVEAPELYTELEAAMDAIQALPGGRAALPPARFQAWLKGAQHSEDELQRLLQHLSDLYGQLKAKEQAA